MSTIDLAGLQDRVAGEVVDPDHAGWGLACQAWNLAADQRPAAVVWADRPEDVAATVRFAAARGLRVAPQGTGHGAMSLGDLAGTVLLRMGRLTGVAVDPATRIARVAAGAVWRDVVGPATAHGLTGPHGSSAGVGVAGYTLGGGVGWFARSHGLAANRVRALDVVTADGEARRADATHHADLFWALRGGGGGAAVVTALELELIEVREAFAGSLMWPLDQAAEIVHGYRAWIEDLPDSTTSALKLIRFPDLPDLPDAIRGQALVSVTLVCTDDAAMAAEVVAPLRGLGSSPIDTLGVVPAAALGDIAGDPPGPLPGLGDGFLLREFTAETADAYVDLAGPDAQVPLIHLEIRQLGGALAVSSPEHGAADRLDAAALVYGVGLPVSPAAGAAIGATLDTVAERLAPWTAGTVLTFAERQAGVRRSFPPAVADRLAAVTTAYDPDGLLVANHMLD